MLDLRLKKNLISFFLLGNTVIGATFIAGLIICLLLRILLRIKVSINFSAGGESIWFNEESLKSTKGTDYSRIF